MASRRIAVLKSKRTAAERAAQIDAITATLPTLDCQKQCQECCGPIAMSGIEWRRIVQRLGYAPNGDDSLICPMLCRDSGLCRVYDIRPLICRLWGLVKDMACPFGCEPQRWLTDDEAHDYLRRVARIGG